MSKDLSGVHFELRSVFRGAFFSRCRRELIQSVMCFPHPGAPPKYPRYVCRTYEIILDGLESETIRFCQVWRQKAQSRILENPCQKAKNPLDSVFRGTCFSSCRTDLIQSALDRGVSGASQKTFPDKFGPFLTSPGSFEVARLVKKRRNFDLNLSFIHVTF